MSPNRGEVVHGEICEGDKLMFMYPNDDTDIRSGMMDMNYLRPPGIEDIDNCSSYDVYQKICTTVLFRMKLTTTRCATESVELSAIKFYDSEYT
eukprot:UN05480